MTTLNCMKLLILDILWKKNGSFTRTNLIGMKNHVKQHILNRNPREAHTIHTSEREGQVSIWD